MDGVYVSPTIGSNDGIDILNNIGGSKKPFLTELNDTNGAFEAPVDIEKLSGVNEALSPEFAKSVGMEGVSKSNALESAGGFSDMFSKGNIGSTLQGIGAIAGVAASIYDSHNRQKYQDKVFKMEEDRVDRAKARQDKQQAAYEKVFG